MEWHLVWVIGDNLAVDSATRSRQITIRFQSNKVYSSSSFILKTFELTDSILHDSYIVRNELNFLFRFLLINGWREKYSGFETDLIG